MIENDNSRYVYVVLSQTPTGFGKAIRKISGLNYNHASIAFDAELNELYSFGRIKSRVPIIAGFVQEYPERFSLRQAKCVNVLIYRVKVSEQQYKEGKRRIQEIAEDKELYMYNLFSVVTFPLLHGFSTYKAFSCSEFVAYILLHMQALTNVDKQVYEYTPEDLKNYIDGEVFYQGNLLSYCKAQSENAQDFFDKPHYFSDTIKSISYLIKLINRKVRYS